MGEDVKPTDQVPKSELEPKSIQLPLYLYTRPFTPTTGKEWQEFGSPGARLITNGQIYQFEEKLLGAYAVQTEPVSLQERKISYNSSFVPYSQTDRVVFVVFSHVTPADRAVMLGKDYPVTRPFLHFETKSLALNQVNELLQVGYPLISAVRPDDKSLLFLTDTNEPVTDGGKKRLARIPQGINLKGMSETIDATNGNILWDDKKILGNKDFLRSMALAYQQLIRFRPDVQIFFENGMTRDLIFDNKMRTLIVQALMHMTGAHFDWHSNHPAKVAAGGVRLGFTSNRSQVEQRSVSITPALIDRTVSLMEECFVKSWPEAHRDWMRMKSDLKI